MKERMLRTIAALLAAVLLLGLCACGQTSETGGTQTTADRESPEDSGDPGAMAEEHGAGTALPDGEHELRHVQIQIRDYGTVSLVLDATEAPITVQNFVDLAESGFYDGLTFHRIMDGFMIQGGDPLGNGFGGSSTTIKGEFSANGWDNTISHVPGVISMARSQSMDSASSQFFICVGDASFLDGQYAAFGWTADEESLAIVQQIAKDARPIDNNGTIPADLQPVIESVTVLD